MTDDLMQRKLDHLESVLHHDVNARTGTGFAAIQFEHNALPELDFGAIDLHTTFLGRQLAAPFLVSSMTGGPARASHINETIAQMAQSLRIAFAVGSQRIALEGNHTAGFDSALRKHAPDVPILANIGGAQLLTWDGPELIRRAVGMIEADALIIHLNPIQEALQHGGDHNWSGILGRIEALVREESCPIVVKEVGFGISAATAKRLWNVGVRIIDVAGSGGTSWAAVEADRAYNLEAQRLGETFRDWGIPTARALMDVRAACPDATIVASGGIRTGLDAAKAIRLGADMVGLAAAVLPAILDGPKALELRFETIIAELKVAAFGTGSATLADLRHAPLL